MHRTLNLETRFALYVMGGRKCVWCGRPISFREMEAEHLIPRSLTGDDLQRVLALHDLPPDYDVEAVRNRAPACRECNGKKGSRIPPDAPIITMVLESAASRAQAVERRAKAALSRRDVEDALLQIERILREEPRVISVCPNRRRACRRRDRCARPLQQHPLVVIQGHTGEPNEH
jgi:hypothetical protein